MANWEYDSEWCIHTKSPVSGISLENKFIFQDVYSSREALISLFWIFPAYGMWSILISSLIAFEGISPEQCK
jgi:hypothetical protein